MRKDIDYRVDVYDILEDGTKWYEKTRWFEELEEADEYLKTYSDKEKGWFATISIETYEE